MTASEFPQKDIDKCKESQTKESIKKIHLRRKKRKAWNWGKQTQKPATLTEDLAATNKGYDRWLFLQGSSVADVWRDPKCDPVKVSTTEAIPTNLELPLLPNLLIHNKHKTIRLNFWLSPRFYSLKNELTNWEDKAKNVWLIAGQLPIKAGWWMLSFRSGF